MPVVKRRGRRSRQSLTFSANLKQSSGQGLYRGLGQISQPSRGSRGPDLSHSRGGVIERRAWDRQLLCGAVHRSSSALPQPFYRLGPATGRTALVFHPVGVNQPTAGGAVSKIGFGFHVSRSLPTERSVAASGSTNRAFQNGRRFSNAVPVTGILAGGRRIVGLGERRPSDHGRQ